MPFYNFILQISFAKTFKMRAILGADTIIQMEPILMKKDGQWQMCKDSTNKNTSNTSQLIGSTQIGPNIWNVNPKSPQFETTLDPI